MSNQSDILTALQSLSERTNSDAFVIFEDNSTQKFVQFVASEHGPLTLDIPRQALNDQEFARAESFFNNLGVHFNEGFKLPLGKDAQKAADITAKIFQEVYLLPASFELGVTEN